MANTLTSDRIRCPNLALSINKPEKSGLFNEKMAKNY